MNKISFEKNQSYVKREIVLLHEKTDYRPLIVLSYDEISLFKYLRKTNSLENFISLPREKKDDENILFVFLAGKSMLHNANDISLFYDSMMQVIQSRQILANSKVVFVFLMNFLNSATAKVLMHSKIRDLLHKSIDVEIYWLYDEDDETSWEVGIDFKDIYDEIPEFIFKISCLSEIETEDQDPEELVTIRKIKNFPLEEEIEVLKI